MGIKKVDAINSTYEQAPSVNDLRSQIASFVQSASNHPNLNDKRTIYDQAYLQIRNFLLMSGKASQADGYRELFILFELYAEKTCYAQSALHDSQEGFRKSERLMELSFLMQMNIAGLIDFKYEWQDYDRIEDLILSLDYASNGKGVFGDTMDFYTVDNVVLTQAAADHQLTETLISTLRRLTYSQQNAEGKLRGYEFNKKYHDMTEALMGCTTIEQKKNLVDYKYNRCGYMALLNSPNDWQSRIKSYDEIEDLYEQIFDNKEDTVYQSKKAQILNMKGLIFTNQNQLQEAEKQFRQAYPLRCRLFETAQDQTSKDSQEFLLANLLTGIINCLVSVKPVTGERIDEARRHAGFLKQFLGKMEADSNFHSYKDCWEGAIKKVESHFSTQISRSDFIDTL